MDLKSFKSSMAGVRPPPGLARPVEALWHAGKGEWDVAHGLVQQDEGEPLHDWVHAHLHRVEGDLANAGHWYRRSGRPAATGALDAEWATIVETLLASR